LITLDHFVAAITGFPARPKLLSIIAWQRRQLDQIVDQPFHDGKPGLSFAHLRRFFLARGL
jgi:hypothetical protein